MRWATDWRWATETLTMKLMATGWRWATETLTGLVKPKATWMLTGYEKP